MQRCNCDSGSGTRSTPTAAIAPLTPVDRSPITSWRFCRGESVMTVVPRLVIRADGRWHGTGICVPQGSWTNVLTGQPIGGGTVDVSELWRDFPVALLERVSGRGER